MLYFAIGLAFMVSIDARKYLRMPRREAAACILLLLVGIGLFIVRYYMPDFHLADSFARLRR